MRMAHDTTLLARTRALLEKHRGQWPIAQHAAGVSYSWVSKVARGETDNPTYQPLQRLHDALVALDAANSADAA